MKPKIWEGVQTNIKEYANIPQKSVKKELGNYLTGKFFLDLNSKDIFCLLENFL